MITNDAICTSEIKTRIVMAKTAYNRKLQKVDHKYLESFQT
jgi:hypothetical protein